VTKKWGGGGLKTSSLIEVYAYDYLTFFNLLYPATATAATAATATTTTATA